MELLRNADVHAPHSLGIRDLLLGGGRVLAMAPTLPPLPPEYGVRITDCEGRRLVPGFVDGHAHLTGGGGEAGFRTRVPALTLSAFTRAGITTAVGLLGTDDVARSTAELLATAKALAEEGLTTFCWTGGYHVPPTTLTGSVRGDLVHVTEIVGAGEIAISDHRSSQPTLDELLRLAADVHVGGLQTGKAGILHLHVGDGVRGLDLIRRAITATELPARVFHPTHVNRRRALFDEALALAADGVTIDVTAFAPDPDDTDAIAADAAIVRYLGTGLPAHRLTVSSDGGGCMPRFDAEGRVRGFTIGAPAELAATLRRVLQRGVPLADALPPFTANPAQLLRLPRKGVVAVGADADLVLLDDEHRVTDVWALGRRHVENGHAIVRGTFEAAVSVDRSDAPPA